MSVSELAKTVRPPNLPHDPEALNAGIVAEAAFLTAWDGLRGFRFAIWDLFHRAPSERELRLAREIQSWVLNQTILEPKWFEYAPNLVLAFPDEGIGLCGRPDVLDPATGTLIEVKLVNETLLDQYSPTCRLQASLYRALARAHGLRVLLVVFAVDNDLNLVRVLTEFVRSPAIEWIYRKLIVLRERLTWRKPPYRAIYSYAVRRNGKWVLRIRIEAARRS